MTEPFKRIPAPVGNDLIGPALMLAVPASAQLSDQMRRLIDRADTDGDGESPRAEIAARRPVH